MIKIVLNPGHGPKNSGTFDPGAVGPSGTREADVNLAVAKLLQPLLEAAGAEVLMVRDGDLSDVAVFANLAKADYFVSIHCNAAADRKAEGTETYIYSDSSTAKGLAQAIQTAVVGALDTDGRGVRLGPHLYVLRKTTMPALLVELAFISNPTEEQLLGNADVQRRIALAIADAMVAELGLRPAAPKLAEDEIPVHVHGADGGAMQLAGKLIDGVTHLPVRTIAEALGCQVKWQPGQVDVWPATK